MTTPVALAWSGGKDSSLALEALRADPAVRVVALITTVTGDYDRISMHGVRRAVLEAQVAELGLPLVEATIPAAASNAIYEEAFAAALAVVRQVHPRLQQLAFGDLFLADVRAYREQLLARLGWTPVFPLWGQDTAELARHFVDAGYKAILTCVDTTQLDAGFAGREFDAACCTTCRPPRIPAGRTASSTPVCMPDRSFPGLWRWSEESGSGATGASSTATCLFR